MTRLRLLAGVGAALAVMALTAGSAAAGTLTITVRSVTVSLVRHDTKPKGFSKGDTIVNRDRLVNAVAQFGRKKGATVGADRTTTTFTSADTAVITGTVTLPGGTLTLGGKLIGLTNGELAVRVVGGSGKYAHAKGMLTVGTEPDNVLNTYRLVLPSPFAA